MKAKTSKSKHASAAVVDSPPWQDADPVPPVSDDAGRHESRWKTRIVGAGFEDPEQLLANPKNWRIHPKEQQDALEGVLDKVGWVQNVVVNRRTGFVVDGHLRVAMSITAGERVPVIYVDLSPEEEALVLATIDPVGGMAARDSQKLSELLVAVGTSDLGELGAGLNDLLHSLNAECEASLSAGRAAVDGEDEAPEPPTTPVSQLGDLWLLGPHRVLCGDSTSADQTARLLAPASGIVQPFLMVTDPPYGVDYDPDWRNRADRANGKPDGARAVGLVANDDRADWAPAWALFPGSVAYVWHASLHSAEAFISLTSEAFEIRTQIIWAKNNIAISRGHYHWQHEPCWYAVRKGATSHWHGDRKQSTLWEIPKPQKSETGHGTQKPVECMRRPILNHTQRGEVVYDPFLGSGTTLIAAELTERVCYGLELDPAYVDVIVQRWQKQTGKLATLDGDGRAFEEVAAERVLVAA